MMSPFYFILGVKKFLAPKFHLKGETWSNVLGFVNRRPDRERYEFFAVSRLVKVPAAIGPESPILSGESFAHGLKFRR
jgi:hypothetical protein